MPITRLSPQLLKTGSNNSLLITASNALTASYALNATAGGVSSITAGNGLSGGTITSTGTIALDTGSTHFISGSISVLNNKTIISSSGQVNGANITNNTVSYTAGAGLSGGGSATLGGGAVTIDAVAGAGISLTAPTNDAININTASAHFVTGSRGTISSANTTGAAGISLTYNNATGIISGTLLNSTVSVTAGNGLTGGGAISLGNSATLDVAAGAGISVTAPTTDAVNLDTGSNHFISGARASISVVDTVGASGIDLTYNSGTGVLSGTLVTSTFNVGAGSGLTGGGSVNLGATSTVNVGAGLGITVNADDIAIDTSSAHFTSGVKSKLNTDGVVSSSTQFTSLTAPFTGSFTGSFRGNLTGTGSWASTASRALTASVVTTNTVSYTAGAGLSGGGSATLGGAAVTIDAVAGAGISLTAPTNDAINIDTGSTHFTGGVKSKLNTDGVVSSSVQFNNLTSPFTGSFTGSFRGSYTGTGTPHFNVKAFGAVGDGTTDDYTAFSASLAAITIAGGGTLYVPKGNYRIGTGLRITRNTNIKGDGLQNTIINCNHLTTLPGGAMISGSDIDRVVIEDLCLSGSGINGASSIGIRFTLNSNTNTSNVILRNLFVNDQAGDGITIATPILTTLQNVKVRYTAGDGFDVTNGTSTNFYECYAVTGLGAGFNLDTMTYCSLVGCASEVYGISYRFNNCSAISVVSCGSEDPIDRSATNPGYTGIAYRNSEVSTTSRVSLVSCYSRDPRTAAPNGHISGSFQTFNFRAQSGSQVLTPFKLYGNSEFVGQLSASAYTSSITSGVGFVGTASYALVSATGGAGGVTINNNTDNYVVTATGTANTLNGEAALQFDAASRRLTVSGSVSSSGAIYLQTGSTLFLGGTSTPAAKQVSGGPEAISFQPGATNKVLLWSGLSSDTEGRFLISTNGFTEWGAGGTNDQDIALFRNEIGNVSVQSFNTSSARTFQVMTSQSTEVLGVDTRANSRRVRINNAAGGATLDLKGDSGVTAFRIEHASTSDVGFSSFVTGDGFIRFYFAPNGEMYWGPGTAVADIGLYRNTTRNLAVQPIGGDSVSTFRVLSSTGAGGTSVFNVDTTNTRIGVGTSTPSATIHAIGNISASSFTSSISNGVGYFGTSSRAVTSSYASSVSGYINFTDGLIVTGTLRVSASSGGSGFSEIRGQELNVLTNGRTLGLYALGSSGTWLSFYDNIGVTQLDFGQSEAVSGQGKNFDLMTYEARGIGFYTNNVYFPKMLISASGNVGINITGSVHKLALSGSFIIGSGSIGVGASPNATLGRIDASNDIVAFSSDKRLKTNISKITSSLERINKLTGFTYNWNSLAHNVAGYDTDNSYVGVYAQEVQAILPEAVKLAPFDNDGTDKSISGENYLTVQYEKLVPLLVEAIKELKAEVDELKRKCQ